VDAEDQSSVPGGCERSPGVLVGKFLKSPQNSNQIHILSWSSARSEILAKPCYALLFGIPQGRLILRTADVLDSRKAGQRHRIIDLRTRSIHTRITFIQRHCALKRSD